MEWYEELDFDENPLSLETKGIGNEEVLKEAFYSIIAGSVLVIEGEHGTGKTKVLKEVIRKFGGEGKVAYLNCREMQRELNVEDVIARKNGLLGFMFKKYPKNMILLLDDVEFLSLKNIERIKYFYDSNHLKSVIITTKNYENLKLNESFKQRVRNVIKVKPVTEFEALQIIRDKLGENILSDRVIKETYKLSGKNMKKFLENTEIICKCYIQNKNLNEEDVKRLLGRGE